MGYDSIRISRERTSFTVSVTDPEIAKKNREDKGPWVDACMEYKFDTKAATLAFLEKAMDIALPEDTYTSAFDKLAKDAGGETDD